MWVPLAGGSPRRLTLLKPNEAIRHNQSSGFQSIQHGSPLRFSINGLVKAGLGGEIF